MCQPVSNLCPEGSKNTGLPPRNTQDFFCFSHVIMQHGNRHRLTHSHGFALLALFRLIVLFFLSLCVVYCLQLTLDKVSIYDVCGERNTAVREPLNLDNIPEGGEK